MDGTGWVDLTNAALGVVTLACILVVVAAAVPEALAAYRGWHARRRLARPVGHSARVRVAWQGRLGDQRWLW